MKREFEGGRQTAKEKLDFTLSFHIFFDCHINYVDTFSLSLVFLRSKCIDLEDVLQKEGNDPRSLSHIPSILSFYSEIESFVL